MNSWDALWAVISIQSYLMNAIFMGLDELKQKAHCTKRVLFGLSSEFIVRNPFPGCSFPVRRSGIFRLR